MKSHTFYLLSLVYISLITSQWACMEDDSTNTKVEAHQSDESDPVESDDTICQLAQQHVSQCLGIEEVPLATCDQEAAETLFTMTCQELQYAEQQQKEDGDSWLDRLHCRIGVLHFCTVPACEETLDPDLSGSCIQALELEGCAQCSYYQCLEEIAQCGSKGYLENFVGKYCSRFMQVTYPRLSQAGKDWMDGVRECLITNMEAGYYPEEECSSIEKRGIDDHISCYVDTGICALPPGDWLKILSTISPWEFPIVQAFLVGNECIKDWFSW